MPSYPPALHSFLERDLAVYFVYDQTNQRLTYVSEPYAQLIDQPAPAQVSDWSDWLPGLHLDDARYLQQQLAPVPADVQVFELRRYRPDASLQWLCLSVCHVVDATGPCWSGRVEDVTRAKEMSIHAQKFTTKKDATLEILSHDMAAPLVLLQQLTEHLRWEEKEAGEPAQQLLTLMERTCAQGLNLIRDFVDHEFLVSVNITLKRERTNLVAWLATIMEEYQRSTPHTRVLFAFHAPPQPLYVEVDINKFQQVVNNLVSNALKFTPDGGRISVSVALEAGQAIVTVADTGIGIPQTLQAGLFERFTKARRPGLRGEKTNGLGMSIIQTIVALHQGTITFASQEGVGTTFTIALPALPQ